MKKIVAIFILLLFASVCLKAQSKINKQQQSIPILDSVRQADSSEINWIESFSNDSTNEFALLRNNCKSYRFLIPLFPATIVMAATTEPSVPTLPIVQKEMQKTPLLKIKGNILYDVYYRSKIDTPFAEKDIYQHTIQSRLDVVYKDQYPVKIYFTSRFSNSSFYRKYTDMNFQFNQADFSRMMKNRLINAVEQALKSRLGEVDSLKRLIEQTKSEINGYRRNENMKDMNQYLVEQEERKFIEERKRAYWAKREDFVGNVKDEIKAPTTNEIINRIKNDKSYQQFDHKDDSIKQKYQLLKDSVDRQKRKVDSLLVRLERLEQLYNKAKQAHQYNLRDWRSMIEGTSDLTTLKEKLRRLNISDSLFPKGYGFLTSIKSFGIGRSMVDYSELSVKNISITGLNVELNPHYYYAVAAGKVDYRFRDYIIPAQTRSNQYVALARFGKGLRNGNHIYLTYYTGKRQFFNSSVSSQSGNRIPEYLLSGVTIEGYYQINRFTYLNAEIAKSTKPYYSLDSLQRKDRMQAVTNFNDRTNEAYSIRVYSMIPKTQTRLTGSCRYLGANFQSFSTFTTGSSKVNWLGKIEQPFFKRQLQITASLQQTDYSNPFIATNYKSSSVLASVQASLRVKKWPALSVGYYPSYQITKISENNYSESRYYSFVANASYSYHVQRVQFMSLAVYSQFYNEAQDSGFVYFNSKNYLFSQSILLNKLTITLNWSTSKSSEYSIYTLEDNNQVNINKYLSAGAGIKYNKQTSVVNVQWGYSGNLLIKVPKLGDIQFMMDKGFLPGMNRQLVENKTGRLTYFKTF